MARLFANENLPEPVAVKLRRLGHDVLTMRDIIVCTFDLDYAALAQRIHQAIADSSTLAGQLVRVNRPS